MRTIETIFRGKRVEIIYQDSDRGIMLSWIGTDVNLIDTITRSERGEIIKLIIEKY